MGESHHHSDCEPEKEERDLRGAYTEAARHGHSCLLPLFSRCVNSAKAQLKSGQAETHHIHTYKYAFFSFFLF